MRTFYLRYKFTIRNTLTIAAILLVIYLSFTYLLPFFAPFVIAMVISLINEPIISLLEKAKVPRKLGAAISLLVTISILGILVTLGIVKIYHELLSLQNNISTYINNVSDQLSEYINMAATYYESLPKEVSGTIDENLKGLTPKIQGLVTSVVSYLLNTLSSIPKITLFTIVTLLATYFISSDRKKIREFFYRQLPSNMTRNISGIKSDTFSALAGYFKAILILVSLTFVEVSLGLYIINAKYALLMGVIVAISDAIPVVGTGVIMVPWILWSFITGDVQMALGLTIIYLLGVIIRQILEPKIVGSQIGLHPLVTLAAMYVGIEIFGFLGVFIGPICIIILKSIQGAGLIRLWKE